MAGDEKAQAHMRRYNIADTKLAEAVFDKLRAKGWIRAAGTMCGRRRATYMPALRQREATGARLAAHENPALPAVPVQNLLCMVAIRGQRTGQRETEGGGVIPLRMDYMREKYRAKPAKAA